MDGPGGCAKRVYATPADALTDMVRINRALGVHGKWCLHGMYRCGEHVHLTSGPGDRALMTEAVTQVLEALRRRRADEREAG